MVVLSVNTICVCVSTLVQNFEVRNNFDCQGSEPQRLILMENQSCAWDELHQCGRHVCIELVKLTFNIPPMYVFVIEFSFSEIVCSPINITNGFLNFTSNVFNANATVVCNEGYLMDGRSTEFVSCSAKGEWSLNTSKICQRQYNML